MKDKFKLYNLNKKYNKEVHYENRWQENDADNFSSKLMEQNYNNILLILKEN
jgi:hypothetical protein